MALLASAASATDPERGARLFATPPAPGFLACADCHSEDPLVTNFGNIFVGRNAASLIQRAVVANTGGMGVFREFYDDAALADIAAYLGNSPRSIDFGTQPVGSSGAALEVVVRASSKLALERLAFEVDGDFAIASSDCAGSLPARASCSVQLVFRPLAGGPRIGHLRVDNSGLPTPAKVLLTGQGLDRPPAQARVQPSSLAFAALGASRQVVLSNGSPQALTVGRITVSSPAFVVTGGTCAAGTVLEGGQSCVMALRWNSADAAMAVLTFLHDGVGGRSDVELSGTVGAAPTAMAFDPAVLDFGVLEVGTKSALLATGLHNRGTTAMRLEAIDATRAEITVAGGSCVSGGSLASGASCSLLLRWSPTRAGAMAGELRVAIAGAPAPARVVLVGRATGQSAWLSLSPSVLPLQAAPGRRSAVASARLVNRGSASARLGALGFEGEAAADFEVDPGSDCPPGRVLAPQESCQLQLAMRPSAAGDRTARLRVNHDAAGAPLWLGLAGTASSAPPLWADRSRIDFVLGTERAASQRVSVFNRGDVGLPLSRVEAVGDGAADFVLAGSCRAGSTLAAGASCTVDVGFVPAGAGPRSATMVLGAAGLPPLAVAVSAGARGSVIASPASSALQWRAEASAPATTTARVGESASLALRLQNSSTATLRVQGLDLAGPAWAEFSVDGPGEGCRAGLDLAAGASCTVKLRFQPAGAGWREALLTARADGLEPVSVGLAATGIAPGRGLGGLRPTELVFDAADSRQRQSVRVENDGAGVLTVQPGVLQGAGFQALVAADDACASEVFVLLPGESCVLELGWSGSAAAQLGGRWTALADGQLLSTTLAVREDPAARSNVGAGALGWGQGNGLIELLIGLALVGMLRRLTRADRPESRHD